MVMHHQEWHNSWFSNITPQQLFAIYKKRNLLIFEIRVYSSTQWSYNPSGLRVFYPVNWCCQARKKWWLLPKSSIRRWRRMDCQNALRISFYFRYFVHIIFHYFFQNTPQFPASDFLVSLPVYTWLCMAQMKVCPDHLRRMWSQCGFSSF